MCMFNMDYITHNFDLHACTEWRFKKINGHHTYRITKFIYPLLTDIYISMDALLTDIHACIDAWMKMKCYINVTI